MKNYNVLSTEELQFINGGGTTDSVTPEEGGCIPEDPITVFFKNLLGN